MRSPLRQLGALLPAFTNRAPVPFVPRGTRTSALLPYGMRGGAEAQMRAMGSVGTLFAIVHRTSTAVALVDWKLYKRAPSGLVEDRTEITAHPALDLWNKPNPFMPRQEFVEVIQQHLDLTGEGWWVTARSGRTPLPLELWPVRPDRMEPVPHPEEFLTGYIYSGPGGERVPLPIRDVVQLRMPNPLDPYRGMGPVQSLLADIDGVRYSAEWNRNFFLNSAEPGGIIEVPTTLDDADFDQLRDRWNEQHRGVANAHRVAILEHGKWVDRKYTHNDMQFAELRDASRDVIREAFGMPQPMLGTVEDANRANMETAEVIFARYLVVPRLERIKAALNNELLPQYGPAARGLEFDFENPVPADRELEAKELQAKANAAKALVDAGAYGPEALEAVGLPTISFGQPGADPDRELIIDLVKGAPAHLAELLLPVLGIDVPQRPGSGKKGPTPAPPKPPTPGQRQDDDEEDEEGSPAAAALLPAHHHLRNQNDDEEGSLQVLREHHNEALTALLAQWEPLADDQYTDLEAQITTAVDGEDPAALAALTTDPDPAAPVLRHALAGMATRAARQMADEAAEQGVTVDPPKVDPALEDHQLLPHITAVFGTELVDIAAATASLVTAHVAAQAGQEALRRYRPGASGQAVATAVTGWLRGLKHTLRRDQLAGALHRAQNVARLAVLADAPPAEWIADEQNDTNTCGPCRDIDGTVFPDLAAARAVYINGAYPDCEGGIRCRGTVRAVWPQTGDEDT